MLPDPLHSVWGLGMRLGRCHMHKYTLCVWKQPATKLSVGVGTCSLFGLCMNSIVNPQQRKFPKVRYNIYEFYCV